MPRQRSATSGGTSPRCSCVFGQALAFEADTLLVGAPGSVAEGPGRAYVFRHAGGGWSEEAILRPTGGATQGSFGSAIEIRGDTAIVGPTASRTVLVFEHAAGTWSPIDELAPSSGYDIGFGLALGLVGAGTLRRRVVLPRTDPS